MSRRKGNQTIKFDHTQNVQEKLFPDPYLKKNKLERISGSSV